MNNKLIRAVHLCLAAALAIAAWGCGDNKGQNEETEGRPVVTCSAAETGILVEWTAVSGAISYEVQYAESESMSGAVSDEATGTNTILEGTDDKSVYYIRVRARLSSGWGEWSDTVSYSVTYTSIVVETYNILNEIAIDKSPWPNRKQAWKDNVLQESNFPDILGIQEAHSAKQRNEIIDMLKGQYNYYVSPKADISPAVVFWKKERFILVKTDLPDMLPLSQYPASSYKTARYALGVKLRERATGKEVLIYNIHLPAASSLSTKEKVALHNKMVNSLAPYAKTKSEEEGNVPVIIMGDMNGYPDTAVDGINGPVLTFQSCGYKDTYTMTSARTNQDYRTYNSQEDVDNCTATYAANGSRRIDYIMVWPEAKFNVQAYEIVINFTDKSKHKVQCPLPSDHNPVRVELELK